MSLDRIRLGALAAAATFSLTLAGCGSAAPSAAPTAHAADGQAVRVVASTNVYGPVERARRRPITPKYIAFSSEFRQGVLRALRNGGEFEPDFPQRLAASVKE